jgi:hypothetical protein
LQHIIISFVPRSFSVNLGLVNDLVGTRARRFGD